MKVLITGGAGFIGSNLTRNLVSKGYDVTVVDNLITGDRRNLDRFDGLKNFRFVNLDISSLDFVDRFCDSTNRFDEVFHLACPTGVPNIEKMVLACSAGTHNVLKAARASNARLVFTSSSEVYGSPEIFPQDENYTGNVHPQGWRASYEEGKRFSETLLSLYVKKHSLNASTVRLFNVYGPKMHLSDYRVIPRFINSALANRPLTVHGEGDQKRTMCFVEDLIDGLLLVSKKGTAGEIYNLGSDKEISMLDLAKKVIDRAGSKSGIEFVERASHDPQSRKPNLKKITSLGWLPKVELDDGVDKTITDFMNRRVEIRLVNEEGFDSKIELAKTSLVEENL